ncbi:DUF3135 domain-containing protein [uncultured Ferrimonas sp.]|uniref:DUF3135 domain-containing protein n=1 Tax=uncultured Ferrimonas sp. TaxID=432640 RepID=UPI00262F4115|nr:DUF3135 domain-containing protein [uncultured Ferrimonas sp.]
MTALPSFDRLKELAMNHPEQLEALRQALIADAISSAKSERQPQLKALQSNIDQRLNLCNNPTQRMVVINQMMHKKLTQMAQVINEGGLPPQQQADIIKLHQPTR